MGNTSYGLAYILVTYDGIWSRAPVKSVEVCRYQDPFGLLESDWRTYRAPSHTSVKRCISLASRDKRCNILIRSGVGGYWHDARTGRFACRTFP